MKFKICRNRGGRRCAPRHVDTSAVVRLTATMASHANARAFVRIPPKDVGMRLDRWLRSRLPQVTQAHLCRLIRKKMVRLAVKDQAATGEPARAPITLTPTWKHLSTDISSRIEAGMFVSLPAELSASLVCSESPRSRGGTVFARATFSRHISEHVIFFVLRNRTRPAAERRVPTTAISHTTRPPPSTLASRSTIRRPLPRVRRPPLRTARI